MNTAPMYAVLLIDDDPIVRRDFGRALADRGLDVRLAADGVEAEQAARDEQFDLILLDVNMPGRGGSEVLRALRAAPHTARTRVYLLAGDGDAERVADAMREGATGVMRKDEMGAEGVAVETSTVLSIEATQEPPRKARPRRVANVPAAIDEIARRFRTGDVGGATSVASRRTRPIWARQRHARPRDAVDNYRQQEQLKTRPIGEAMALASTRFGQRPAPGTRSTRSVTGAPGGERDDGVEIVSRDDVERTEYDTLLNRFAGDAVLLIEELGVPVDLVCTSCRERLVLRLRPDEDVRAGVRGYFVCGSCGQL